MSPGAPTWRDPSRPLPLLQVGAGQMGRAWLQAVARHPDVELVGLVDLDVQAAAVAAAECGHPGVPVGPDLHDLLGRAEAVLDVTSPPAHHAVTSLALDHGLPVLGEKPAAATLGDAIRLAAAAEVADRLFMVSQSRRYDRHLTSLRSQASSLGRLGPVSVRFARAPRFGGFRESMEHPLLLDMAIHPFDAARHVLGADAVAVYCEEFNPPWSWYAHDACATAMVEMSTGARLVYQGSWCSPGAETSWNGEWVVGGEHGTATWDGDAAPVLTSTGPQPGPGDDAGPEGIDGALDDFVVALRTGGTPMGEIHDNVASLAMVEAAVRSATLGRRVLLADVLAEAHEQAVDDEPSGAVRERLVRGNAAPAPVAP